MLFATTTTATIHTISETTGTGLQEAKQGFATADVLLNLNTLILGSAGNIVFSVQERFSGVGFVETGRSGTISSTISISTTTPSNYWLLNKAANSSELSGQWGSFSALGKGLDKRVVITTAGVVNTLSADIYFVFYQD